MMYCPECLNETLKIMDSGVVYLSANGKQMDAGKFLYNLRTDGDKELAKKLHEKAENFFKWYSTFNNKTDITEFLLTTTNIMCLKDCVLKNGTKVSVINEMFSQEHIEALLQELGKKYKIGIDVKF